MDIKSFGVYLKNIRTQQKLSTHRLAELSGVSQSYISHVENGRKENVPSPEILKKLAGPLGVSYASLMMKAGYWDWLYDEDADPDNDQQDLGWVLHADRVVYKDHLLSEQDKKLIAAYLELLFPDDSVKE